MKKKIQRRSDIYDLARIHLHREGVNFVFRRLQEDAGLEVGTLRRYYRGKDAIVFFHAQESFKTNLRPMLEYARSLPSGEALAECARRLARWLLETHGLADLMLRGTKREGSPFYRLVTAVMTFLAPLVSQARADARLRKDIKTERFVVAICSAALVADLLVEGPPPETFERRLQEAEAHLDILLHGMRLQDQDPAT